MKKPSLRSGNQILFYTMLTLILVAIFITANSYFTQVRIFQEKELFKLECVANALSFKIDGDKHKELWEKYPNRDQAESVSMDSVYMEISAMLGRARDMNMITSEIYTMVYDTTDMHFLLGVSSSANPIWMDHYKMFPDELLEKYEKGGWISEPYQDENGTWLSAFSPIFTSDGEIAGVLQVDEKFDTFIQRSRSQIYMNIVLSLVFISILGLLMFFSVKNILGRQQKLETERMEIERLRKDLLANVSHDLRTPLSSIHGYLETIQMKRGTLPDEQVYKYLDTSLKNAEKLKNLVDELFELSVLESRERNLELEPTNFNDLALDVINDFRLKAENKGIEFRTQLIDPCPGVYSNIALLERILQNVIANSIRHCEKDDIITLSTEIFGELLEISITDTGSGIPAEDLENIFDRFTMGTKGKTGTGLGLAIVKNILDLHNATYEITSEEGKGTRFSFRMRKVHD